MFGRDPEVFHEPPMYNEVLGGLLLYVFRQFIDCKVSVEVSAARQVKTVADHCLVLEYLFLWCG